MVRDEKQNTQVDEGDARLRDALCAHPVNEAELKDAVCALVDRLKAKGWPVERVIVHLKRLGDAAKEIHRGRSRLPDAHRAAVEKAVTWCIERYFEAPG